ncbi:geranylgeranyl pyrophosphate synthase [Arthrobacter globiformis]|nr:geranylgeranyl pyrophosphate synthase [Arthrobacter globiformis]
MEKKLREAIANSDPLADATSRHLVEAGGKRIRPLLTLLCAHLGDASLPAVVQAAVVVELTHLATLYHDDVMDSAPFRRGAPTAHEVWGNSVAVLTGDLIFARASILVSELGGRALGIQARTFERLCLGQLHETVGPRPDEDPVEHYLSVIADKTGSLVAASGQFGAIFSGADEAYEDVLVQYGEKVGVAFQLADDVIDVTGVKVKSGKSPGTDLREGVPTLPVLLLRKAAADGDQSAVELLKLIDGDLSSDEALAEAVAGPARAPRRGGILGGGPCLGGRRHRRIGPAARGRCEGLAVQLRARRGGPRQLGRLKVGPGFPGGAGPSGFSRLKRNGPGSLQRYESNAARNRDRLSVRIRSTGGIQWIREHSMTDLSHPQNRLLIGVSHTFNAAVLTLFGHPH